MIQASNAFDPSIRLNESLTQGSNPNVIPDITIRGENGFDLRANADDATTNPNAPLYILDGVEVSAERIYDMDLNRVESTTILKDASATAAIWVSGCQRSDCHYDYPSESRTNPDKPECQLQRFNPGFEGL